ncbi:hypothetical protein AMK19_33550 [Kitasatospora sp. CB01950]|nr:hypothetical protein AMK19_33550 [Kitasatospora sp. CB01950]
MVGVVGVLGVLGVLGVRSARGGEGVGDALRAGGVVVMSRGLAWGGVDAHRLADAPWAARLF